MKNAAFAGSLSVLLALTVMFRAGAAGSAITIRALSTDPNYVTGGDVLVQITAPATPRVTAGGRDVSAAFKPTKRDRTPPTYVGLVTGLGNGRNTITAGDAKLEITNYPITGPVLSGPWQQPFICQTDTFKLPDGTTLGKPLDAACSAKTVVQYVYKSTAGGKLLKSMPVVVRP